jgi:hypothetical protein
MIDFLKEIGLWECAAWNILKYILRVVIKQTTTLTER